MTKMPGYFERITNIAEKLKPYRFVFSFFAKKLNFDLNLVKNKATSLKD